MTNPAPAPHDAASPAADEGPDPSILRAERRLMLLAELADIGMELARELRPGVHGGGACDESPSEAPTAGTARATSRDPADAFGALSRAIRLTLALEAKTDADLRDLKAGVTRERAEAVERAGAAAKVAREERLEQVRELVFEAACSEIKDVETLDEIYEDLETRLAFNLQRYMKPELPLRQLVEGLCAQLSLTPDWSRWTGEDWAEEEELPPRSFSSPKGAAGPGIVQSPGAVPPEGSIRVGHDLQ